MNRQLSVTTRGSAALVLVALIACQACRRGGEGAQGIVVVNAPAAGEIRRVLASEGMQVTEGQPIVEIAIDSPGASAIPSSPEEKQTSQPGNVEQLTSEIEAARTEVVRREVEVQRLTPLVSAGQASQPDLDAARFQYQRAQQHLQTLKTAAQQSQARLAAEQQRPRDSPLAVPLPTQQLIIARASAAGTVSALSARTGERVTAGQPLATIRVTRP
jgi:multidrug resistance efflux pump